MLLPGTRLWFVEFSRPALTGCDRSDSVFFSPSHPVREGLKNSTNHRRAPGNSIGARLWLVKFFRPPLTGCEGLKNTLSDLSHPVRAGLENSTNHRRAPGNSIGASGKRHNEKEWNTSNTSSWGSRFAFPSGNPSGKANLDPHSLFYNSEGETNLKCPLLIL